jgi:hypothetical protein
MKIIVQSRERVEDRIRITVAVMDGTTELFGRAFEGRTANELKGTLANFQAILSNLEDELEAVPLGEFTAPQPEPVSAPVEPTPEELKAQEIATLEAELQAEVERVKREREIAAIALENEAVAAKVTELEALKTKK